MISLRTRPRQWRNKAIYLAGVDGSGKTTQARLLVAELRRRGHRCRYVWLRFPQLVSLPVLAVMRITGITRYRSVGGRRIGSWHLSGLRPLAIFFMWCQVIDAALVGCVKIGIPLLRGRTIVVDRFAYDIVVDIAVAASDPSLLSTTPARLLRRIGSRAQSVFLDAPADLVTIRRAAVAADPQLEMRIDFYRRLARAEGVLLIDASRTRTEVQRQLREQVIAGGP